MGIFLCGFVPAAVAAIFIAWWFIYHKVFYPRNCDKWDDEKKAWVDKGNKFLLALYKAGDSWLGVVSWIVLVVGGCIALVFAGWMTWTATHTQIKYDQMDTKHELIINSLEVNDYHSLDFVYEYMEEIDKIERRSDNFMWKFIYNSEISNNIGRFKIDLTKYSKSENKN